MNHQEDEYSNGAATPRKIVLGRHPAVFVCVIQCIVYIYITGSGWLGFSDNTGGGYNLLFAVLWAAMAFGIYKYSRACAAMALVLYFIDQLAVELFPPGRSFNVAWLAGTTIWLLCFCRGIIACWMRRKHKVIGIDDSTYINKRTLTLYLIVLVLFHSSCLGLKQAQKHTRNILWQAFYQSVMEDKSKIPLPIKIDNNTSLTDIYFDQHTLIVEHHVRQTKLANLPMALYYAHAKKLYSRYCANDVASSLDLKMIVRFAQGYETRDLSFTPKDCQF